MYRNVSVVVPSPNPCISPQDQCRNYLTYCYNYDSVESVHEGNEDNVVAYIPAGPDCPLNRAYLRKMRPRFESGARPPDFEWFGQTESEEQKFVGRGSALDLSEEGKRTMGL